MPLAFANSEGVPKIRIVRLHRNIQFIRKVVCYKQASSRHLYASTIFGLTSEKSLFSSAYDKNFPRFRPLYNLVLWGVFVSAQQAQAFQIGIMAPYEYSKLEPQEIRIVTLAPGPDGDPIHLFISHELFNFPEDESHLPTAITPEHENNLPLSWEVSKTIEGRIIYNYVNPETGEERSSWDHPASEVYVSKDRVQQSVVDDFKTDYEALSYTWGTSQNPRTGYVENDLAVVRDIAESCTTLELRENLACALKHLRYTDKPRRLWIDAICINQKDIRERGSQVSYMYKIYKFAQRVVAWLGPELIGTKIAISTISYIGQQVEVTRGVALFGPSPDCVEENIYKPGYLLPYDDETLQFIYQYIDVTWFERVWVIQEIQLSNPKSVLLCGTQELSWALFRRCITCLDYKRLGIPEKLRKRLRNIASVWQDSKGMTLPTVLNNCRTAACGEPVDKIYGMLGIGPRIFSNKIQPDYGIYYGEAYKRTFLEHARIVQRFELFGWSSLHQPVMEMPTWVPNFSKTCTPLTLFTGDLGCASGFSCADFQNDDDHKLKVLGLQVSIVLTVGTTTIDSMSELLNVVPYKELQQRKNTTYLTGESFLDALASTVSCCFLLERHGHFGLTNLSLQKMKNIILTPAGSSEKESAGRNHNYLLRNPAGRKFISTEEGYIGFVPDCALPGEFSRKYLD